MNIFRGLSAGIAGVFILGFSSVAAASSLTVTWDSSPDPEVTGYIVWYGTQPGVHPVRIDVGGSTSQMVGGLTDGERYYFVVQAYNTLGVTSEPSAEVSGTPGASTSAPVISCPAPSGTSPDGMPIILTFAATVSGGAAPVSGSCSPPSGSAFPVGTTNLTCTATDGLGLSASCTSVATVTDGSTTGKPKPTPPGQTPPPAAVLDEIAGSISQLTGKCANVTFTVAGRTVVTNSATQYEKGSCGALNNGKTVTVGFAPSATNVLTAIRIQLK